MSLRHALLALLEAGPMTGYELAKQFDRSVDYIWHARHSQIYTELRRLEAQGLVQAQVQPRGSRELATKRPYRVTAAGIDALLAWVADNDAPLDPHDSSRVRATYLEYGSAAVPRGFFRAHRRHFEQLRDRYELHVEELRARATPLLRRRLQNAPAASHDAIVAYKVHAYEGLVARARAEIEWADRGLDLVAALERDAQAAGVTTDAPLFDPRIPDDRR